MYRPRHSIGFVVMCRQIALLMTDLVIVVMCSTVDDCSSLYCHMYDDCTVDDYSRLYCHVYDDCTVDDYSRLYCHVYDDCTVDVGYAVMCMQIVLLILTIVPCGAP